MSKEKDEITGVTGSSTSSDAKVSSEVGTDAVARDAGEGTDDGPRDIRVFDAQPERKGKGVGGAESLFASPGDNLIGGDS